LATRFLLFAKSEQQNAKTCLVFDAWDLEFKQEELFSGETLMALRATNKYENGI